MEKKKPEEQPTRHSWLPGKDLLFSLGELVLVLWALGVFYHFYDVRGYFRLVQALLAGEL